MGQGAVKIKDLHMKQGAVQIKIMHIEGALTTQRSWQGAENEEQKQRGEIRSRMNLRTLPSSFVYTRPCTRASGYLH